METPCINVCVIDPDTRECVGCLRTIEQITQWSTYSDDRRASLMASIQTRRANGETIDPAIKPPTKHVRNRQRG